MVQPVNQKRGNQFFWVISIFMSAVIALSAWAISSPVGSSPDDNFHLSSIWCAQGDRDGLCESVPNSPKEKKVSYVAWHAACFNSDSDAPSICSDVVESHSGEMAISNHGNFTGLYPGGFYGFLSIIASENVANSSLLIRMVNTFLFVLLAFSVYLLLPLTLKKPLAGSLLFTMVPLGIFLIPSTNPSSWAITAISLYWVSLMGFLLSEGKTKICLATTSLLLALVGASARADTALMIIMMTAITLFIVWGNISKTNLLWQLSVPLVVAVFAICMFGFSGQASVTVDGLDPNNSNSLFSGVGLAVVNIVQVPELWFGALGTYNLGWLDTPLPALVPVFSITAFVGLLFWGLGEVSSKNKQTQKINVALIIIGLSLWAYPTYVLFKSGAIAGSYFQPRYLLPLMTVLLGFAFLRKVDSQQLSQLQVTFLFLCVSVSNSLALYTNLKRYTQGLGSSEWNLDQDTSWWWHVPIGPMLVWALGTIAFTFVSWFICFHVLRTPMVKEKL